jgi:type I restriction enzyme S subunit
MTAEDLRKSILQQAIQGKLVPQDPTDEPASALLARIREEKARLVKEKKIKKDKNESLIYRGDDNSYYEKFADGTVKCIDEEIPFEIPQGWEWARLREVSIIQEGPGIRSFQYRDSGVQLLTVTNILEGDVDLQKSKKYISKEEYIEKYKHFQLDPGDIVCACSGGSWGKSAIYNMADCDIILNTSTLRLRFYGDLANNIYLYYVTKTHLFKQQLAEQLSGMQPNFGYAHYSKLLIPIPPLNEQQRIANRIAKLECKVNDFRSRKEKINNLEVSIIPELKKSILQYAIQGNLVPHNSEDEPASELLKRIEEEKARLVKAGKIKRDKNASVIFKGEDNKYFEKKGNEVICIDDELPFEIPESWMWTRLGNCCTLIGGYAFKSHEIKSPHGHRVIRISDISDEGLVDNNIVRYNGSLDLSKYQIIDNDILIAMTGGTVGKSMLYARCTDDVLLLNQRVAIIRSKLISPQYIYAFIRSPYIKEIIDNAKNSTNDNISMADISSFLIPLPPLNEQKRIVEALDNVVASIMRN